MTQIIEIIFDFILHLAFRMSHAAMLIEAFPINMDDLLADFVVVVVVENVNIICENVILIRLTM